MLHEAALHKATLHEAALHEAMLKPCYMRPRYMSLLCELSEQNPSTASHSVATRSAASCSEASHSAAHVARPHVVWPHAGALRTWYVDCCAVRMRSAPEIGTYGGPVDGEDELVVVRGAANELEPHQAGGMVPDGRPCLRHWHALFVEQRVSIRHHKAREHVPCTDILDAAAAPQTAACASHW